MPNLLDELLTRAMEEYSLSKPVSTEARTAAIDLLRRVFSGEVPEERQLPRLRFQSPPEPPALFTPHNPGPYSRPQHYIDDPQSEMAIELLKRTYPAAYSRVGFFETAPQAEGVGAHVAPTLMGTPAVSLGPSNDSLPRARHLLYHEMGHVMGLPDYAANASGLSTGDINKLDSAYDVGLISDILDRDILLKGK